MKALPNGFKLCSRGKDCKALAGPWLKVSEFHRQKDTADGYASQCKACANAYERQRYQAQAVKIAQQRWLRRRERRAIQIRVALQKEEIK
jgi:hypothetical protein